MWVFFAFNSVLWSYEGFISARHVSNLIRGPSFSSFHLHYTSPQEAFLRIFVQSAEKPTPNLHYSRKCHFSVSLLVFIFITANDISNGFYLQYKWVEKAHRRKKISALIPQRLSIGCSSLRKVLRRIRKAFIYLYLRSTVTE